jgi:membrane glycosyltransferase
MQCCDLPQLPGRKPFGGQILSHDFVEAALLLAKTGRSGSPTTSRAATRRRRRADRKRAARPPLVPGQFAARLVLFARGLRGVSRLHLILGIFGYLSGPLWLAFLLTFNWIFAYQKFTGLSTITMPSLLGNWSGSGTAEAFLIFLVCMVVIMLPKALALHDLADDWPRRDSFGGLARATAGVVGETVFSTLHAPLLMLWHTRFVASNLLGTSVGWVTQKRSAAGTTWHLCGSLLRPCSGGSRPCWPA